jgi:hypothetical protein
MSCVIRKEYKTNGTNLGGGIGSIYCRLSRENNRGNVAILTIAMGISIHVVKMERPLKDQEVNATYW